jgi:hypothetical protein
MKDSDSKISVGSESPDDPFGADLKKIHDLANKSLHDEIEDTSDVEQL